MAAGAEASRPSWCGIALALSARVAGLSHLCRHSRFHEQPWYAPVHRQCGQSAADPGRAYREKKRQAELTGSVDAKRALAEESIKLGLFAEAIELYQSAMQGPLGGADPALLKGLARAQMLAGDGAASETLFLKLKQLDPAAFDTDAELDYARALELQGKNDAALRQYEAVALRYPGEEARCRFALLLEQMGETARAQALFREILASVKGAPGYYRSRQSEWVRIARQHLRS